MIANVETPKKWYVYLLCDPDTEVPFYVGKGTKDRAEFHMRGVDTTCLENKPKRAIIRKIQAQGKQVLIKKLAFFEKEEDAYIYEWAMICLYHGHITNIKHGKSRLYSLEPNPDPDIDTAHEDQIQPCERVPSYILDTQEVANYLKVSVRLINKMANKGELKSFRVGDLLRFRRSDIDEFIEKQIEQKQKDGNQG